MYIHPHWAEGSREGEGDAQTPDMMKEIIRNSAAISGDFLGFKLSNISKNFT